MQSTGVVRLRCVSTMYYTADISLVQYTYLLIFCLKSDFYSFTTFVYLVSSVFLFNDVWYTFFWDHHTWQEQVYMAFLSVDLMAIRGKNLGFLQIF